MTDLFLIRIHKTGSPINVLFVGNTGAPVKGEQNVTFSKFAVSACLFILVKFQLIY